MRKNNALALWGKLKKLGNFSDKDYDACIIKDLKIALEIKGDFEKAILKIKEEDFLISFFDVISPLTEMYTDILNLFERSGAQVKGKNIEIQLQSTSGFKNFNSSHFIEARNVIEFVKQYIQKVVLTNEGIMKLRKLSNYSNKNILNKSFKEWISVYKNEDWPVIQLDFLNVIKTSAIKNLLTKVYKIWTELFSYYKSFNIPRNKWREFARKQNQDIIWPETDNVLGLILSALYYIAENYQSFTPDEQKEVTVILQEISKYVQDDVIKKALPVLENFLRLPIWEFRHEIYSIWIFTRMIADIPDSFLKFNLNDNTLKFTFNAELLATVLLGDKQIDFWHELKTKIITHVQGEGRKEHVQPDYSVVCGYPDNADNSIIVAECKQYKNPDYKNFCDAVVDYANNRPKAKILLTNYGKFNIATLDSKISVVSVAKKRYELLPSCCPKLENAKLLSKHILDLICDFTGVNIGAQFTLKDSADFTLDWGAEPKDLDLHLFFYQDGLQKKKCYYIEKNGVPDAQYFDDIKTGYGSEIITIDKLHNGVYELWVNNYSKNPPLSGSGAKIAVAFNATKSFVIDCPKADDFQWWHVLTINTNKLILEIVNKLAPEPK